MTTEIKVLINAKGVLTGLDQVKTQLNSFQNEIARSNQQISNSVKVDFTGAVSGSKELTGALTSTTTAANLFTASLAVSVISSIFRNFVNFTGQAIDQSILLQNSLIGIASVAKSTGNNVDQVTEVAKNLASDGLIPLNQVASSLKSLLASGLNIEQASKLLGTLKDAAAFNRQGFLDLGQAVEGAAQGFKNSQSILLDNVGITKNISNLEKDYAQSIGKTVGQLTEAEKVYGRYVGVLKEGAIFTGDAIKLTQTYSGAQSKLGAAYDRLLASAGDFITQNKAIINAIDATARSITGLNISIGNVGLSEKIAFANEELIRFKNTADELSKNKSFGVSSADVERLAEAKDAIKALKIEIEELNRLQKIELFKGSSADVDEAIKNTKRFSDVQTQAIELQAAEVKQQQDNLRKELKTTLQANIEFAKSERDRRLKDANGDAQLVFAVNKKYNDDTKKLIAEETAARKKEIKEQTKAIEDAVKDAIQIREFIEKSIGTGLSLLFRKTSEDLESLNKQAKLTEKLRLLIENDPDNVKEIEKVSKSLKEVTNEIDIINNAKSLDVAKNLGAGLSAITQGASGAKKALTSIAKLGIESGITASIGIPPEIATAFLPLIETLAQGPEHIKQMISDFAEALPTLVENLILAIPAIITSIVEQTPRIITSIIEKIPEIVRGLAEAMPDVAIALSLQMPYIAVSMAKAFIENIPLIIYELAAGVYDAIIGVFQDIGGFFGGGGGEDNGLLGLGFAGLATGGQIKQVPNGYPNDSYNARLTSSELVVDTSTTEQLKNFLNGNANTGNNDILIAMLGRIENLLSSPQQVTVKNEIASREISSVIYNLQRNGERLK